MGTYTWLLNKMRATIRKAAPKATEKIAWRMPAYTQNGYVAFFAAAKYHVGFYPLPGANFIGILIFRVTATV